MAGVSSSTVQPGVQKPGISTEDQAVLKATDALQKIATDSVMEGFQTAKAVLQETVKEDGEKAKEKTEERSKDKQKTHERQQEDTKLASRDADTDQAIQRQKKAQEKRAPKQQLLSDKLAALVEGKKANVDPKKGSTNTSENASAEKGDHRTPQRIHELAIKARAGEIREAVQGSQKFLKQNPQIKTNPNLSRAVRKFFAFRAKYNFIMKMAAQTGDPKMKQQAQEMGQQLPVLRGKIHQAAQQQGIRLATLLPKVKTDTKDPTNEQKTQNLEAKEGGSLASNRATLDGVKGKNSGQESGSQDQGEGGQQGGEQQGQWTMPKILPSYTDALGAQMAVTTYAEAASSPQDVEQRKAEQQTFFGRAFLATVEKGAGRQVRVSATGARAVHDVKGNLFSMVVGVFTRDGENSQDAQGLGNLVDPDNEVQSDEGGIVMGIRQGSYGLRLPDGSELMAGAYEINDALTNQTGDMVQVRSDYGPSTFRRSFLEKFDKHRVMCETMRCRGIAPLSGGNYQARQMA